MAADPINTSHRRPGGATRLVLGIVGLCGIAALMAALVWVLQGQVQQAEVLRSQWQGDQGYTRANRARLFETGPTVLDVEIGSIATPIPTASKSAIVAASLNRP